jgi:hypothetical protein
MFGCEKKAGQFVALLATCFCIFTLVQTSRPLESIALFSHPGVSAKYHELTRHTLKEVGGKIADLSAAAMTESGTLTFDGPSRISRFSAAEAPVRPAQTVIHRRIPSPPDGSH